MNIISHLKEQNERLLIENQQMKADIKQVASSIRKIWEKLDIDPKSLENANKLVLMTKILPKISKKEVQDTFSEEWAKSSTILDNYKYLITE
jgi:hypothetical protein